MTILDYAHLYNIINYCRQWDLNFIHKKVWKPLILLGFRDS